MIYKDYIFDNCKYKIFENGDIFSYKRNCFVKQFKNSDGYLSVNISGEHKRVVMRVHRLVGICFVKNNLPYSIDELTINHKDFNKNNNHYSNLEWMTRSDNSKDSYRQMNHKNYGSSNKKSKLNEEKVIKIKSLLLKFSDSEIAKIFNVSPRTIYDIRKNKTWKYIK